MDPVAEITHNKTSLAQTGVRESHDRYCATFEEVLRNNSREPALSNGATAASGAAHAAEEEFPLESFALPDWYASLIPGGMFVETELNRGSFAFAESLYADGEWSDQDKNMMKQYLDHDPTHQRMLARRAFRAKHENELSQYQDALRDAFRAALQENGVVTHSDYYEKIHLDKAASQRIHADMEVRLKDNPRFLELMEILGTSF